MDEKLPKAAEGCEASESPVPLSIVLLGWAAARHQEGVMNTLAVLGLTSLLGAMGFTVLNAGAAGLLIIGVQFAGFAILLFMLWSHWSGRAGMWRRYKASRC